MVWTNRSYMTKLRIPGRNCSGCNDFAFGLEVQDEGDSLGTPSILDFEGDGVTVTATGGRATILIPGGGGGGGGAALVDHPIASGAPAGAIAQGARYYLTGSPGVILGEDVAEGTTMEARIANPTLRAHWYFNFGGT